MEQQRILWIAASVGVFLLVVVGAALLLYAPARPDAELARGVLQNSTWTRIPGATGAGQAGISPVVPPPQMPQITLTDSSGNSPTGADNSFVTTRDVTVITDNTQVISRGNITTIDLTSPGGAQTGAVPSGGVSSAPPPPVVPAAPPASAPKATQDAPAKAPAPPKAPPAPPKTSAAPAPKTPAAPPAATVSAPKKMPGDEWWVQAAAYSSKKNADNAREALMANKIPCEVFTYTDSAGKVFYRMRVGPYTTRSEAEYWQSRISQIKEFSSGRSYVTNGAAQQ